MTDIVLNGVSIADLKKTKALIQKDAYTFIANGIKDATTLLESILSSAEEGEELDKDGITAAAAQAAEILENVDIVSDVSGVEFYLPYYAEYSDERTFSSRLEDTEFGDVLDGDYLWRDKGPLGRLYSVLEGMEGKSKQWHNSNC